MKREPYLAGGVPVGATVEWVRSGLVLQAGGGQFIGTRDFLVLRGQKTVWITRDAENRVLLNLDVRRADGTPLFTMVENDWTVSGEVHDVEVPPQGRSLTCVDPSEGFELSLTFSEATEEAYRAVVMARAEELTPREDAPEPPSFQRLWDDVCSTLGGWPILVVKMTAKVKHPVPITITDTEIRVVRGGVRFTSSGQWSFSENAIQID